MDRAVSRMFRYCKISGKAFNLSIRKHLRPIHTLPRTRETKEGGIVKKSTMVYSWNMNTSLSFAAMNLMKKYAIKRTFRTKSNFKKSMKYDEENNIQP